MSLLFRRVRFLPSIVRRRIDGDDILAELGSSADLSRLGAGEIQRMRVFLELLFETR